MTKHIFEKYPAAIRDAEKKALVTVAHWGSLVDRSNRTKGGHPYSTYKAVCRRDGVFANRCGTYDWNEQLLSPMTSKIASGWNCMFTTKLPSLLAAFAREIGDLLKDFHQGVDILTRETGTGQVEVTMLRDQLLGYQDICKDLSSHIGEQVNKQQKEINRQFICAIQLSMKRAYEESSQKSGMLSP